MEKINTMTADITAENEAKLLELFPQVATEIEIENGGTKRAIDFDALRELLGDIAEGQRERYQFTWPGKRAARQEACTPCGKTLRPILNESVNWDDTKNLYIEGNNLEALKILRETYANSFDLIYIDPPYNTGGDFVYVDNFTRNAASYNEENGELDEHGGRLVSNPETNGRFHSDWCSMIYSRLLICRDLLSHEGVLAISIGYQEITNLTRICEEVFSNKKVMGVTVQTSGGKPNNGFSLSHEYVLFVVPADYTPIPLEEEMKEYSSPYHGMNLATFNQVQRPNQAYPIFVDDSGKVIGVGKTLQQMIDDGDYAGRPGDYVYDFDIAPAGAHAIWPITAKNEQCVWRLIPERLLNDWSKGYIKVVRQTPTANANVFGIQYLSGGIIEKIESGELKTYRISDDPSIPTIDVEAYKTAGAGIPTIWNDTKFYTARGSAQIKDLFGAKVFSYPKPLDLVSNIVRRTMAPGSMVLDFFSGSATTAHAVMSLNAEDNGDRRFVMVQLSELCPEDSQSKKEGFDNICQIGEERIRRAAAKIREEVEESNRQLKIDEEPKTMPDLGFRVLRIDSSNFRDTSQAPGDTIQMSIDDFADNLKEGRTDLDLLFQVLPAFRIEYSADIREMDVCGKRAFDVNEGQLVACFDLDLTNEVLEEIARMEPVYAVFRDASLADDATAANLEELFKTYSPDTVRRVI